MRNVPLIHVYIIPAGMQDIPPVDVSNRVISLKYEDIDNKADKVVVVVNNEDLRNFDEPIWRAGSIMMFSWGYPDAMAVQRLVRIRKISGFKQLAVEGYGGEVSLDFVQYERTFPGMTVAEIVRQIARYWGFVEDRLVHIEETPLTTHRYDMRAQGKLTDAQFVRLLARQCRMVWYIDHNGFHFERQPIDKPPDKTYRYFSDSQITEILDINIDVDVTRVPGKVQVKAYDPKYRHGIRVNATDWSATDKKAQARRREVAQDLDWHIPGLEDAAHGVTIRSAETNKQLIINNAQAALAEAQKEAVKLRMTVMGDPNIYAKSVIEIEGIGERLSQRYYVQSVTHAVGSGYICELECLSDGSNGTKTKSRFFPEATIIQPTPRNDGGGSAKKGEGSEKRPGIRVDPEVAAQQKREQEAMEAGKSFRSTQPRFVDIEKQLVEIEKKMAEDKKLFEAQSQAYAIQNDLGTSAAETEAHNQAVATTNFEEARKKLNEEHEKDIARINGTAVAEKKTPEQLDAELRAAELKHERDQTFLYEQRINQLKQQQYDKDTSFNDPLLPPSDAQQIKASDYKDAESKALRPSNVELPERLYVRTPEGAVTQRFIAYQGADNLWHVIPTRNEDGRDLTRGQAIRKYEDTAGDQAGVYATEQDAFDAINEMKSIQDGIDESGRRPPPLSDQYK